MTGEDRRANALYLALTLTLSAGILLALGWVLGTSLDTRTQDAVALALDNSTTTTALPSYPGLLDHSFGNNGIVTTTFGGEPAEGRGLVLQPDAKIVAAGYVGTKPDHDFALARYNSDGSLDTTFGSGGLVVTDLGRDDYGRAIERQPDGKIVVAGYTGVVGSFDIAVVRYTVSGTLDTAFGHGGVVTTELGLNQQAHAIALQDDGKIVLAGDSLHGIDSDLLLLRYTTTGTLDTTFGTDGVVTTSISSAGDFGQDIAVQQDGKIVVGGYVFTSDCDDAFLARYTISGTLDATFGNGGVVTTTVDNRDTQIHAVALDEDNIIAVGASYSGLDDDMAVFRYTVSGTLDATFGDSGIVTTDFGGGSYDRAHAVDIQGEKIFVAGQSSEIPALVRYRSDGTPDTGFGVDGLVRTDVGGGGNGHAVAVQPDGKPILAGYGGDAYFALVRYRPHLVYLPLVIRQ